MRRWMWLAALGLCTAGVSAHAGRKATDAAMVIISYWATGDLGAVRANTTTNESIGCSLYGSQGYSNALCWAQDRLGNYRTCYVNHYHHTALNPDPYNTYQYHPGVVSALAALNGDSRLEFSWSGANSGECNWVKVSNASDYRPKSI